MGIPPWWPARSGSDRLLGLLGGFDRLHLDGAALGRALDDDLMADVLLSELLVVEVVDLLVGRVVEDQLAAAVQALLGAGRVLGVGALGGAAVVGDPAGPGGGGVIVGSGEGGDEQSDGGD